MLLRKRNRFDSEKIFVIGLGKTGTTSLELVLKEFGYTLGHQRTGEKLLENWAARDFKHILDFCHTADAFQDVPFGLPYTFIILDQYFPNAKFILTVRDDENQWYDSLINFHGKIFSNGINVPPSRTDLENAEYIYKGRPFRANRLIFNTPDDDLYEPQYMKEFYLRHIRNVREYFSHKPFSEKKFIEINVSNNSDYERLCRFLDKKLIRMGFPWENKT